VSESLEREGEGEGEGERELVLCQRLDASRVESLTDSISKKTYKPLFEKKVTQEEFEFFNGAFSVQEANGCMCIFNLKLKVVRVGLWCKNYW
jgi:hypothetical protein